MKLPSWRKLTISAACIACVSAIVFQQYKIWNLERDLAELDERTYIDPMMGPPRDELLISRVDGIDSQLTAISRDILSLRATAQARSQSSGASASDISALRRETAEAQRAAYNAQMDILDAEQARIQKELYRKK